MTLGPGYWWDLSTGDFSAIDKDRMVAILPVATVEQHGPHLPVGVDSMLNIGVVERALPLLPHGMPAFVLPMIPVGKSTEHLSYPGTLSLSFDTLARVWIEIGESVHRAGCNRIILFNSHGGQIALMEIVARELRQRFGLLAVAATWFSISPMDDLFSPSEQAHGFHGGEIETSAMLATRPELVDMAKARDFRQLSQIMAEENEILRVGGAGGFGWLSEDLHPSGVSGNAAAADTERGEALMDRAARRLVTLVQEVSAFPLSRLANRPDLDADL